MRYLTLVLLAWLAAAPMHAGETRTKVRHKLYITNSAGDDVTVVDTATNKQIGRIVVGKSPHGIAVPAAQDVILVSIESAKKGELVWIDPQTDQVTKRMDIGPAPNQLAVTPDGKFAYVPVNDGHWEVIDVAQGKIIERIFTGGRPHNTLCSTDGKHMYLAPMGAPKKVTIVDTAKHKIVGEIPFTSVVRPVALSRDEKRLFAEVDGLIGIEMADVPSRKMIHRVPADLSPEQRKTGSRSHGLCLSPDEQEIWACDVENFQVQVFDVADAKAKPKQVATIPMGGRVYWLTFSPDGKYAYVAVRSKGEVAVVDTKTRAIVARVAAGLEPKRLLVVAVSNKK